MMLSFFLHGVKDYTAAWSQIISYLAKHVNATITLDLYGGMMVIQWRLNNNINDGY